MPLVKVHRSISLGYDARLTFPRSSFRGQRSPSSSAWRRVSGSGRRLHLVVSILASLTAVTICNSHRMASSNTLFKFRCVRAEHSRYLCALISLATCTACSYWMGAIFFCLKLSLVASSSLRSSLVPTRMMGTPGAWCSISGYHYKRSVSEPCVAQGWKGAHLGLDVVERGRANNREADEEHVGLRVGQRAQTVVILLTGSIPETQADGLAIDHDIGGVVIEPAELGQSRPQSNKILESVHCRDILAGEGVRRVRDQKACLHKRQWARTLMRSGMGIPCQRHRHR